MGHAVHYAARNVGQDVSPDCRWVLEFGWARPHSATDERSEGQRRADALAELARRALEAGRLPQTGGVRPQLTVLVDLDSLQGRTRLGGDTELGPLAAEGCRRLACDGAVTRVLVTHQPDGRLTATPPHRPQRRHPAAA